MNVNLIEGKNITLELIHMIYVKKAHATFLIQEFLRKDRWKHPLSGFVEF